MQCKNSNGGGVAGQITGKGGGESKTINSLSAEGEYISPGRPGDEITLKFRREKCWLLPEVEDTDSSITSLEKQNASLEKSKR